MGFNVKLPKDFVKKHLEKSRGCTFFGIDIEELTKEELIACAVSGWPAEQKVLKQCTTCLFKYK